jgi:NAD(P)-dependent dehydrogenase (short-subunit alcohol dehydrogenase family)
LTANYRLIRSLDTLLKASKSGRALFLTSSVANSHPAYWGAYAASKAALEAFVSCYAKEVEITDLKVNLLNPGAMRTAMRAKAMPGENPEEVPNPLLITPLIVDMLSASCKKNDSLVNFRETIYYKK